MRVIEAKIRARRFEHGQLAWAVWHVGVLNNMPGKKYPKLRDFMGGDEKGDKAPVEQKSPDQIRSIMTQWAFVKAEPPKGLRPVGKAALRPLR